MIDAQHHALEIVKKLVRAGYTAYFAGGWVRDYLMGHPSDDIDIATDAPPEKILDLFPRTILVGLAFGIVVVVHEGHSFEVATFRKDIEYRSGRRPERIELSTASEDALRRDFTINGMFYDPIENVIHDFVHGQHDLKLGLIRSIGDPHERFFEDRLRMIRAIRFAARFGFSIESDTELAIRENAFSLFPAVAMERVWQEFNKMAAYPHFDQAIIDMHRLNLLPVIFPELKETHLNEIKKRVAFFASYPPSTPTILYLMALFPGITPEKTLELSQYLRISNQEANRAAAYLEAKFLIANEKADTYEWVKFYAKADAQMLLEILSADLPLERRQSFLKQHVLQQNSLHKHIERIKTKRPLVSSTLLKSHLIPSGKLMGTLLKEGERLSILHDLNEPDPVIFQLKQLSIWPKEAI